MNIPEKNKTPSYILKCQKSYYERIKANPEKLAILKEKRKQYYASIKNDPIKLAEFKERKKTYNKNKFNKNEKL